MVSKVRPKRRLTRLGGFVREAITRDGVVGRLIFDSTEIVHLGMVQWLMDFGSSFVLTEESMAWLSATKKGKNDPKDTVNAPCSTEGAPEA